MLDPFPLKVSIFLLSKIAVLWAFVVMKKRLNYVCVAPVISSGFYYNMLATKPGYDKRFQATTCKCGKENPPG